MRSCMTTDVAVQPQLRKASQDVQVAGESSSAIPDILAVLEVSVCLQRFVNLEMRSQGWYSVRVKLLPNPRIKAVWTYTYSSEEDLNNATAESMLSVGMESGVEQGWSWRSKVFRVQYCYDKCRFGPDAIPCFQVFVRNPSMLSTLDLRIELELVAQLVAPNQFDSTFMASKLKPVASEVLQLRNVPGGMVAYHPVSWGIDYWGLCHIMIGTCLLGFTTRESVHSMGWAVGRDLRRPRGGGAPRRSRQLLPPTSQPQLHALTNHSSTPASSAPPSPRAAGTEEPTLRPVLSLAAPLSSHSSFTTPPDYHRTGSCGSASGGYTLLDALQAQVLAAANKGDGRGSIVSLWRTGSVGGGSGLAGIHASTLTEPVRTCLEQLYKDLVMPLLACTDHLASALRLMPHSCYAPQTYDTMKALVRSIPLNSHQAFSAAIAAQLATAAAESTTATAIATHNSSANGAPNAPRSTQEGSPAHGTPPTAIPNRVLTANSSTSAPVHSPSRLGPLAVAAGGGRANGGRPAACPSYSAEVAAADVATWERLPEPRAFLSHLPPNCGAMGAVMYLHAVLTRVMIAVATEWGLLQWLLESSSREMARCLRCHWEMEQPDTMAPWVISMCDLPPLPRAPTSLAVSVSRSAERARAQLVSRSPLKPPKIARVSVWDNPLDQPVLLLDDTLGPHFSVTRDEIASLSQVTTDLEANPTFGQSAAARGSSPAGHLPSSSGTDLRDIHLVVFVHGYQGAATDLGPIKAHLHALYPSLDCRFSSSNEGKTDDALEVMGGRLADEVIKWITALKQESGRHKGKLAKLSFIGHSLGAVIVRTALANKQLSHLLPHLWLLISVGGPHLGQLYSNNGLLSAGLGLLKVIKKGGCLQQLDLSDMQGQDLSTAFLYRLTTSAPGTGGTLQAFKRVVLVACEQDRYVPSHSAEVSWCEAALKDKSWKRKAYTDMVNCSIKGFGVSPEAPQLLRVGVHFTTHEGPSASFLGDILGRTAHIALIESDELARQLAWGVVKRFSLFEADRQPAWL